MLSEVWQSLTPQEKYAHLMRERYGDQRALEEERGRVVPPAPKLHPAVMPPPRTGMALVGSPGPSMAPLVRATRRTRAVPVEMFTMWLSQRTNDVRDTLDRAYRAAERKPELAHLRERADFTPGCGPTDSPQLMIITGVPTDMRDPKPIGGQHLNMLASMLWGAAKLHVKDCFVTSVLKYRPVSGSPTIEEVTESLECLRRELLIVMPKGGPVLMLGSIALSVIFDGENLDQCHGKLIELGKWTFVPMWSPGFVAGRPRTRESYKADFASLATLLTGADEESAQSG